MKLLTPFILLLSMFIAFAGCETNEEQQDLPQQTANHNLSSNSVEILEPWIRPASQGGNSAGYLNIYNGTNSTDTLLAVSSDVAGNAAVHESFDKNDISGMRPAGTLRIASGSTLKLEPGHFHIMLMQLNRNLAEGDSVDLELEFTGAGMRTVRVPVKISGSEM